jgi:hypothetical protein
VPPKSNKQKNFEKIVFVGVFKVKDDNFRNRIRIHWSEAWIHNTALTKASTRIFSQSALKKGPLLPFRYRYVLKNNFSNITTNSKFSLPTIRKNLNNNATALSNRSKCAQEIAVLI